MWAPTLEDLTADVTVTGGANDEAMQWTAKDHAAGSHRPSDHPGRLRHLGDRRWRQRVRLGPGAIAGFRRADQADLILTAASIKLTGDGADDMEAGTRRRTPIGLARLTAYVLANGTSQASGTPRPGSRGGVR
jgi:hypothetical protein